MMETKRVKDIMVPLGDYAVVNSDATVFDALTELNKSHKNHRPGRHPHRAVLIKDKYGYIVGKLGHLTFIKAFEPKYSGLNPESWSILDERILLY